jgi:hypothetical protein
MDVISITAYKTKDGIVFKNERIDIPYKNELKEYLSFLLNDKDFLSYDNKIFKISYVKLKDYSLIVNVLPKGLSIDGNMEYFCNIIDNTNYTINPFYLIGSNIFTNEDINTFITDDIISNYFTDNYIIPFNTLLQLILDYKDTNKTIVFTDKLDNIPFWFHMIALIIPEYDIKDITFSYGGDINKISSYSKITLSPVFGASTALENFLAKFKSILFFALYLSDIAK